MRDFHAGHPKNTLSPHRNSLDSTASDYEKEGLLLWMFNPDLSLSSPQLNRNAQEIRTTHGPPQAAASYLTMDPVKTPAESAREKTLLTDPLALVLSPSLVECKQCQKRIKLSSKSAFDTFHWRNHRARCLKTIKKRTKGIPLPRRPISTPCKAATSPKLHPRSSKTPPLIDISDSEDSVKSPGAQSLPSTTPPSRFATQTPLDDRHSAFDKYMLQSHPECFHKPLPIHWQSWSWSQLKEPHFPMGPVHDENDDLDDDEDRYSSFADEKAQAAHTLSMLSRSR